MQVQIKSIPQMLKDLGEFCCWKYEIKDGEYGLANVAPTVVKMMGFEAPACWEASMI